MSFAMPSMPAAPVMPALPPAPAPAPFFGQQTQPGSKPGPRPEQPTFISAAMRPGPGQPGQRSLIGGIPTALGI
jgi:hypothetical protein